MHHYGFGQPTGIDLTGEIGGILPSPATKAATRKERWYPGDTVNASIGQGDWKVTPLQLVHAVAGLADGQLRRPHLAVASREGFDAPWLPLPQPAPTPISPNPENVQVVREAMMATMQPGGSGARTAAGAPYTMAGKTGTAQVVSRRGSAAVDPRSLPMHLRHRALFVGFAPAENPQIAVAVAVEGGGYGGTSAGPIARKVFDAWLLGKLPEGMQPLDSERGLTALAERTLEASKDGLPLAQVQAARLAALAAETAPVQIGAPAPAPSAIDSGPPR